MWVVASADGVVTAVVWQRCCGNAALHVILVLHNRPQIICASVRVYWARYYMACRPAVAPLKAAVAALHGLCDGMMKPWVQISVKLCVWHNITCTFCSHTNAGGSTITQTWTPEVEHQTQNKNAEGPTITQNIHEWSPTTHTRMPRVQRDNKH